MKQLKKIKMNKIITIAGKSRQILIFLRKKLEILYNYFYSLLSSFFRILLFRVNPFWIQLMYQLTLSLLGFIALKTSNPRTTVVSSVSPTNFDIFFTSLSSATSSSMSTVEMEFFSNTQLIFITILMFCGGEVFTSMLGLYFRRVKINHKKRRIIEINNNVDHGLQELNHFNTKSKCLKILTCVVSSYLLVVHVSGFVLISLYLGLVPGARRVLARKGLNVETFSIMTAVSTFANCGFLGTNENMMVFKGNSGLQLILIPLILIGNTMYTVFLRLTIVIGAKISDGAEFKYILKNSRELGYNHLFPGLKTLFLGMTVLGFILVQFVVFCALEWNNSEIMGGLSNYQKLVAVLFQVVNVRHAGESVFDLSALSPAILVIFVVVMYLPSYTVFLPIKEAESVSSIDGKDKRREREDFWGQIDLSQLSYLVIFIFLICITERENIKRDPLNFSIFNVVLEVISAYGNVGFSIGYNCEKRINQNGYCQNAWYGFAGRWSTEGKFVLIVVMLFGRLKKLNLNGGKAWSVL